MSLAQRRLYARRAGLFYLLIENCLVGLKGRFIDDFLAAVPFENYPAWDVMPQNQEFFSS